MLTMHVSNLSSVYNLITFRYSRNDPEIRSSGFDKIKCKYQTRHLTFRIPFHAVSTYHVPFKMYVSVTSSYTAPPHTKSILKIHSSEFDTVSQ